MNARDGVSDFGPAGAPPTPASICDSPIRLNVRKTVHQGGTRWANWFTLFSRRSTVLSPTKAAISTGRCPTKRFIRSSTISSVRSARTSSGGSCTRRWRSGRHRTCSPTRRPRSASSRGYGKLPTRSSSQRRSGLSRRRIPGSRVSSTRRSCGSSRTGRVATSRSAGRRSPPRRSGAVKAR